MALEVIADAAEMYNVRLIIRIPEEEMVAHFLQTELHSERFGKEIRRLLDKKLLDAKIIEHPNLQNPSENVHRADLLGEFRGYRRDADVFTDFPDDVQWWQALLNKPDLERVKYINDEYWIEFSGGSRRVIDAAKRIVSGVMPDVAAGYLSFARAIEQGAQFPELIMLYNPQEDELVVLEGHVRITAYLLYLLLSENTPSELPVLVGCSDLMRK